MSGGDRIGHGGAGDCRVWGEAGVQFRKFQIGNFRFKREAGVVPRTKPVTFDKILTSPILESKPLGCLAATGILAVGVSYGSSGIRLLPRWGRNVPHRRAP